jgi:hypothetical protein
MNSIFKYNCPFCVCCSWEFLKAETMITAPELDKKKVLTELKRLLRSLRGTTTAIPILTRNAAESLWGSQGSDTGAIFPNLVASS